MPTKIVRSPSTLLEPTLFLGGSISGAWDWQKHVIDELSGLKAPLTILNPRRDDFDVHDPDMEREQIEWEFRYLRVADAIMFWFSGETIAPITLFELGRHSIIAGRPLFIGIDPTYKRLRDIRIQMNLVAPNVPLYFTLVDVLDCVKQWANRWEMDKRR